MGRTSNGVPVMPCRQSTPRLSPIVEIGVLSPLPVWKRNMAKMETGPRGPVSVTSERSLVLTMSRAAGLGDAGDTHRARHLRRQAVLQHGPAAVDVDQVLIARALAVAVDGPAGRRAAVRRARGDG